MADLQYLLGFADGYTASSGKKSWTPRQVCVFQRFCPSGTGNLYILLNAKPNSKVQTQIIDLVRQPAYCQKLAQEWHTLHTLVLSSYLDAWRWYIGNISREIADIVSAPWRTTADHHPEGISESGCRSLWCSCLTSPKPTTMKRCSTRC